MHFIGIDIARKEHFAGIRTEADESLVVMEATGHYWMALFAHLSAYGFRIVVANPSLVNAFRKADTMRKTKTDAIDCFLIAEYARFKRLAPSELNPEDAEGLKLLTRYRAHLVDERTSLKNRAASVIDRVFPELADLFGGLCSATPQSLD